MHHVVALLQLSHHHLNRNNRVVNQQSQGNDQGAQRDLVQSDAPVEHCDESDSKHQRDRDRDNQPRPDVNSQRPGMQTQGDETDCQHDRHSLDQDMDKFIDRAGHRLRLILDLHQFNAGRQVRPDLRRSLL